jgi:hypothetical protein
MADLRYEDTSDRGAQILSGMFSRWTCKGNASFLILTMYDQGRGVVLLAIHKQDHHLAVAVGCPVVWALTFKVCQAGSLKVKCLHGAETCFGQFFLDQRQDLSAGVLDNQKWK